MEITGLTWQDMLDSQLCLMLSREAYTWYMLQKKFDTIGDFTKFKHEFLTQFVGGNYKIQFMREIQDVFQKEYENCSVYVANSLGSFEMYNPTCPLDEKISHIIHQMQNPYMREMMQHKPTTELELIHAAQNVDVIMKHMGLKKVTDPSKVHLTANYVTPDVYCHPNDSEKAFALRTNPAYYQQEFQRLSKERDPKNKNPSYHQFVLPREANDQRSQRPNRADGLRPQQQQYRPPQQQQQQYGGFNRQQQQTSYADGRQQQRTYNQQQSFGNSFSQSRGQSYNQSGNYQRPNTSYQGNGNYKKAHYSKILVPAQQYQNSRAYYNSSFRSNQQQAPQSTQNRSNQQNPQQNQSRNGQQRPPASVVPPGTRPMHNTSRSGPKPTTPFKAPAAPPANRFSKHSSAFLIDDIEFVETYQKDLCEDANCDHADCADVTTDEDDDPEVFYSDGQPLVPEVDTIAGQSGNA